jgi:hypothetical protein
MIFNRVSLQGSQMSDYLQAKLSVSYDTQTIVSMDHDAFCLEVGMIDKLIEVCMKGASSIFQLSQTCRLCSTKADSQMHSQ